MRKEPPGVRFNHYRGALKKSGSAAKLGEQCDPETVQKAPKDPHKAQNVTMRAPWLTAVGSLPTGQSADEDVVIYGGRPRSM